jgi:hypothetical protein
MHQKDGNAARYDPYAITHEMQADVLEYYSDTPLTDHGQTKWLTLLTARQMGKSLTCELGAYPKAAYTRGYDHVCIADNRGRAEYLHNRVHFCHNGWESSVRSPTLSTREVRQLTFDPSIGGKMRVLSGESGAVGIGQSPDSFHGSELPFWSKPDEQWSFIVPSIINRDHALVVLEATPWVADEWWHDQCRDAKLGTGRWKYLFYPFWDGKLNQRPWPENSRLDDEEERLLKKYGAEGLTLENLAFRRLILETDPEIRKAPELFQVFYPLDDVSCWLSSSRGVFSPHILERHKNGPLGKWEGPYAEYSEPRPDAMYVIGVDPAGHAARDHAAFQVFEVWDGCWEQVAVYAEHTEPLEFTKVLTDTALRYNRALIVCESNGVGQAVLKLLENDAYPNVYQKKPGWTATGPSIDQALSYVQDALVDTLVLHDPDTVDQLQSYRHDKRIEDGVVAEIVRGRVGARRRERHHWDKISALQVAVVGARRLPAKIKPGTLPDKDENVIVMRPLTFDERTELHRDKRRRKRKRYWL